MSIKVRSGAAALLLLGCSATDCTEVGCTNGVAVSLSSELISTSSTTLVVCLDERCQEVEIAPGTPDLVEVGFDDMAEGQTVTADVVTPDGTRYSAMEVVERFEPNGPDCEPRCFRALLSIE